MSEWWTYSLSDFLLFSPRTYYRLFELYNAAVWPLQLLALAIGIAILALSLAGRPWQARAGTALLACCWSWVAWAYLWERYETVNWAASYFALAFAVEALLLIAAAAVGNGVSLPRPSTAAGIAGVGIFLLALLGYPLIGPLLGRPWLQAEFFGVMPDPTVAATLGLLSAAWRRHWGLLGIPVLWALISGATLWAMQSPEALLLPAAAALALVLAICKTQSRAGSRR
jgi:Family of unknown function (DUF6064)